MDELPSPAGEDPVGFIGLGVMGAPMARRLRDAGVPLLAWNRTRERAVALGAAVRIAGSPADVARRCGVVLSCLLDDDVIESAHGSPDGTLAAAQPGTIVVEHGTFSPQLARELAAAAAVRGCVFLDAPVTGGAAGAAAGTLTTMVGGDGAALVAVRPVLAHYARLIEHVGPSGSGVALKLINQMLVAAHTLAATEAAMVVKDMGIPADVAERVLTSGWASSAMLARTLAPALRDRPLDEGAEIHHLVLALSVLHDIVASADLDTAIEPVVLQRFRRAMELGMASTDISGMIGAYAHGPASRPGRPATDLLAAAVADNVAWCEIVCAAQDFAARRDGSVWSVPSRAPDGYPDAITLAAGLDPSAVLRHLDTGPGCSVKDSYADVDLSPHGFEILFAATWIARPAGPGEPVAPLEGVGWEVIDDGADLGRWAAAHGLADAFRPSLLRRHEVRILGRRAGDGFGAGAVATSTGPVVGLSNVFCRHGDPAEAYAEAVRAARSCYPARTLVGYESGEDLEHAVAAGFRPIGPLRVWIRS